MNDNLYIDETDGLYKIRPIMKHLNVSYLRHGGIEENLSIDESLIPQYGKHYAKQYILGHPIRFGSKNWALNSASGFIVQFDIYMGKTAKSTPKGFGVGGDKEFEFLSKANVPSSKGFKAI